MEADFWLERWRENKTAFDQEKPHPLLERFFPQGKSKVFVPLCGRSIDMKWFLDTGISVVGVELYKSALEDFIEKLGEKNVSGHWSSLGDFEVFSGSYYNPKKGPNHSCELTLYAGDFFKLQKQFLEGVDSIYDRASLIALPVEMRVGYAKKCQEILPKSCDYFAITLQYDQSEMQGPPFSVDEKHFQELFQAMSSEEISCLSKEKLQLERFQERGVSELYETVYRFQVKKR